MDGEDMADRLYEAGVFDSDDEEQVSLQSTQSEKNLKFLSILMHKRIGKALVDSLRNAVRAGKLEGKLGGHDPGTMSKEEVLTGDVAVDIVNYMSALEPSDREHTPNMYKSTMRRLVQELLDQQASFVTGLIESLALKDMDGLQTITGVTDEMFSLGDTTWGTIIVSYCFFGFIAKYVTEQLKEEANITKEQILEFRTGLGSYLGYYTGNKFGKWIQDNGGWDSFLTNFPEKDSEFSKKTMLFISIGVATIGIAAIFAFVARTKT